MYFPKLEFMCIIRFKWREVPVPVVREGKGWVGGLIAFIQKVWHLYNSRLAFIQFHTGIYTISHCYLYNNTLAFIQQHTGIYTSHVSLPFSPKLFMALCHEWHADKINVCHPWQSAAQFFFFLPKLFMALCHERHMPTN